MGEVHGLSLWATLYPLWCAVSCDGFQGRWWGVGSGVLAVRPRLWSLPLPPLRSPYNKPKKIHTPSLTQSRITAPRHTQQRHLHNSRVTNHSPNQFTKSAHPNIHKQSPDVSRTAIQLQTHDTSHHAHAHHHEYHHKSTRLRLAALTTRTDRQTTTSNTELCHGKVRRAKNCSRGRLEMFTAHTMGLLQYRHPGMRPRRNTPTNLLDASPAFSAVRVRPTAPLPNMTLDSQPNPLRPSAPKSISKISTTIRRLFFGGWWYDDERLSRPRAHTLAALRDTIPSTPRSHSTTNMSTSHNVKILSDFRKNLTARAPA